MSLAVAANAIYPDSRHWHRADSGMIDRLRDPRPARS